ncbi:FMN-dependent NADH-azoreductase [Epibacterium ulvae]|uniref:FMN dependent NADH:quinone oxidoreductase n=1 Tax=Epibacterium ulvae TaxID=1156985 RepID=A0A1G5QWN8_9RHOB|nr:NAD(P)H-dependent oxidoreductase [Epibacterium ulvae]SCZ66255.1 FMN-dependent NADH-azoreductase [Epibacterium ulvae]
MTHTILHIDSSARFEGSVSRELTATAVAKLGGTEVIRRDLAQSPLPVLDETWVGANFTAPDARSNEQKEALSLSDALIAELKRADTIVIGAPVYNFSVPSTLKAWIDLIFRVGETFSYTETGPKGLIEGKRVILVSTAGGTPAGSEMDHATTYLRHALGFIGITNIELIAADQQMIDPETSVSGAKAAVDALAA